MMFQFTHPGKGATRYFCTSSSLRDVSIHAPWEGCDALPLPSSRSISRFNSRTLGRVRRRHPARGVSAEEVSIHAPWEGCDEDVDFCFNGVQSVSIHAPWEGCDLPRHRPYDAHRAVSIHAPWEGCDRSRGAAEVATPSFNSRTLGRVRRLRRRRADEADGVSIHAPWEGCDARFGVFALETGLFQFTHPGKGATRAPRKHRRTT